MLKYTLSLVLIYIALAGQTLIAQDVLHTTSNSTLNVKVTKVTQDSVYAVLKGSEQALMFHKKDVSKIVFENGLVHEFQPQTTEASNNQNSEQGQKAPSAVSDEEARMMARQDAELVVLADGQELKSIGLFVGFVVGSFVTAALLFNMSMEMAVAAVAGVFILAAALFLRLILPNRKKRRYQEAANPELYNQHDTYTKQYNKYLALYRAKFGIVPPIFFGLLFTTVIGPIFYLVSIIAKHKRAKKELVTKMSSRTSQK